MARTCSKVRAAGFTKAVKKAKASLLAAVARMGGCCVGVPSVKEPDAPAPTPAPEMPEPPTPAKDAGDVTVTPAMVCGSPPSSLGRHISVAADASGVGEHPDPAPAPPSPRKEPAAPPVSIPTPTTIPAAAPASAPPTPPEAPAASPADTPVPSPGPSTPTTPPPPPPVSVSIPPPLAIGVHTDIGGRSAMEDAVRVVAVELDPTAAALTGCPGPVTLVGVFDGHNGPEAATALAARMEAEFLAAVSTVAEEVHAASRSGPCSATEAEDPMVEVLGRTFTTFEQHLLLEGGGGETAGTAALLLALVPATASLYVGNVGDCRAVASEGGRVAVALTTDHRADAHAADAQRLAERGVPVDGDGRVAHALSGRVPDAAALGLDRLQLTRSLGDAQFAKAPAGLATLLATPDVAARRVPHTWQFVMAATDGVWDRLSNGEAMRVVRNALEAGRRADAAAEALVAAARRLGSTDNAAAVVLQLAEVKAVPRRFGRPVAPPAETAPPA